MARQPLMSLSLVGLALGSCLQPEPYAGAFELPIAAAVLQPEVGGPFQEPVGLVANGHGGQIVPLALKQGRFLTDDPTAAFLRTHQLATGDSRLLTSLAVRSTTPDEVTVWAGDLAFEKLLRVPWIVDCANADPEYAPCQDPPEIGPVEARAYFERVEEPESASLTEVQVSTGWTTTETWIVEYDGRDWRLEGSRSGLQPEPVVPGEPYSALDRRLQFTLRASDAQPGDRFVIKTRSGLSEHEVGGAPLALQLTQDQSLLAVIVHDRELDRPVIRWFDPVALTVAGEVLLPADARPHRLSLAEDGLLLVADRSRPSVWEVAPGATQAREIRLPWPTLDAASLDDRLYVAPLDGLSLWLVDRDSGDLLDVNPALTGEQGMTFTAPIRGIEAIRREYLMPEFTDDQVRRVGRSVAISLSTGNVVFAHEDTGCLVQDTLGPKTRILESSLSGAGDFVPDFQSGVVGPPTLETLGSSDRHVLVNSCAGIAKEEEWFVRYDQPIGAWRVEGSLTGEQRALAHEDERYLTDQGEVSFTIRSGATPTRDGWEIRFQVDEGVAVATGDVDGDNTREVSVPISGDPVYFFYRVGRPGPVGASDGEGFYKVDVRPFVLVPGASSDEVGRVDPQEALIEIGWE